MPRREKRAFTHWSQSESSPVWIVGSQICEFSRSGDDLVTRGSPIRQRVVEKGLAFVHPGRHVVCQSSPELATGAGEDVPIGVDAHRARLV